MDIKETIIHYIDVYSGSEKRVIEKTANDCSFMYRSKDEVNKAINANINWLLDNNYIEVVDYSHMDDSQKSFYNSDGYCTIYKVIKRYNESEYLKEKYGE